MTPGRLDRTGNDLDIAINGEGWFVLETEDGTELFSRVGHFNIDEERNIVGLQDYPLLGEDGDFITLKEEDHNIEISRDGTVSTENGVRGRLKLVEFENEEAMTKVDSGLYASSELPTDIDVEETDVQQGMLELSNVNSILEMTRMIKVLRAYQSGQKLLQTDHDLELKAIQELTAVK